MLRAVPAGRASERRSASSVVCPYIVLPKAKTKRVSIENIRFIVLDFSLNKQVLHHCYLRPPLREEDPELDPEELLELPEELEELREGV